MAARIFLALLLFFIPIQTAEVAVDIGSVNTNDIHLAEQSVNEQNDEDLVPAKEALEKPQKWVNIILVIIFIIAIAAFVAIAVVMKKSEK